LSEPIVVSHAQTRYYVTPPDQKTVGQCASHGADHAAYGWNIQLDPRWSEDQKAAYLKAYNEGKRVC
jgi:hypothetical protein